MGSPMQHARIFRGYSGVRCLRHKPVQLDRPRFLGGREHFALRRHIPLKCLTGLLYGDGQSELSNPFGCFCNGSHTALDSRLFQQFQKTTAPRRWLRFPRPLDLLGLRKTLVPHSPSWPSVFSVSAWKDREPAVLDMAEAADL